MSAGWTSSSIKQGHGDVPTCSEGSLHLGHDLEGVPADAALSEGHDMFGSFDLCPHEISTDVSGLVRVARTDLLMFGMRGCEARRRIKLR